MSPAGSCSQDGVVRYQDEMWKGSACRFCVCDRGQVTCRTGECARVECAQVRREGASPGTVAVPACVLCDAGPSPAPAAAEATARRTTHISQSLPAQGLCGVKQMSLFVQTGSEQPRGALSSPCICSDGKPRAGHMKGKDMTRDISLWVRAAGPRGWWPGQLAARETESAGAPGRLLAPALPAGCSRTESQHLPVLLRIGKEYKMFLFLF